MVANGFSVALSDQILVTGANGFVGSHVVAKLMEYGFTNVRCLVRSEHATSRKSGDSSGVQLLRGDLSSPEDCRRAVDGVDVVYHLAGGTRGTSFADADADAVRTMQNLLDAVAGSRKIARFVHVSSFTVYSNVKLPAGGLLDEACPLEMDAKVRGEPYTYAKIEQEALLRRYAAEHRIPHVILRPGAIYGPGSTEISGRVGIWKKGVFLHLGNSNIIPLTYVSNCAEAIVLAGVREGIEGEVINIVDDQLVTSQEFLRMYATHLGKLRSVSIPKVVSYCLFTAFGMLARLANSRTASKYNRMRWCAYWKGNTYSNAKARRVLQWVPRVATEDGLQRYFGFVREARA